MKISVDWIDDDACVITVTPNWFRRLMGERARRGDVVRDPPRSEHPAKYVVWVWKVTRQAVTADILDAMRMTPVDPLPPVVATRRLVKAFIERTPGVCGGRARVAGTRIPVWMLHALWRSGASDDHVLTAYPLLSVDQLRAVRAYGEQHPDETKE